MSGGTLAGMSGAGGGTPLPRPLGDLDVLGVLGDACRSSGPSDESLCEIEASPICGWKSYISLCHSVEIRRRLIIQR